jgi:hypothetical protein
MPTRTQESLKMMKIREFEPMGFVTGTETTYPGREEKRRLGRIQKHAMKMAMKKAMSRG